MKNNFLIIDFDSTFIKCEGLEVLAQIVLDGMKDKESIVAQIEDITNQGMNGEIDFRESLARRLNLLDIKKDHINKLIEVLRKNISESVLRNRKYFQKNKDKVYIISGGFKEFIGPVVKDFGIKEDHVLANSFEYNEKNEVVGFDEGNPLSDKQGKVKILDQINLDGYLTVVGDGWTDYEMVSKGRAHEFVAFVENVKRENVLERADRIEKSFDFVFGE